jgi:hypothetical protein
MATIETTSYGTTHTLGVTTAHQSDWSVGVPIAEPRERILRPGRRFVAMWSNDRPQKDIVWYADASVMPAALLGYFIGALDLANKVARGPIATVHEAGAHRITMGKHAKKPIQELAYYGNWSYLNWMLDHLRAKGNRLDLTTECLRKALSIYLNDPRNNAALVRAMHGHS